MPASPSRGFKYHGRYTPSLLPLRTSMFSGLFLILSSLFQTRFPFTTGPTVSLDYGTFLGTIDGNLTKYLGVPYALPATRFELPEPPLSLTGLQDATQFGPSCPQQALSSIPIDFPNNPTSVSEDCLNLDVILPTEASPTSKLPVLVWIYGGAFEVGNTALTDVRGTVERSIVLGEPVIIVALNYRVSAFGFLAGQEVLDAGVTNLGIRDQTLALEWVQKHISAFGGDPTRVVIGGQSAGAVSTGLHLLPKKHSSTHLFRGAVMMSGIPWALPSATSALAQTTYDTLVRANNCSSSPDTLACLRNVPFDEFMQTVNQTPDVFSYSSLALVYRPRVDGDVVLRAPLEAVRDDEVVKVPLMAGGCEDEGTLFSFSSMNVTTDSEFVEYVHTNFLPTATSEQVSRIATLYPQDPTQGSPFGTGEQNQVTPQFKRIAAFQGDLTFIGLRRFFLTHVSKAQDTWSWVNKRGKSTPTIGAFHSSDLSLFFPPPSPVVDTDTDTVVVDSFINFINTLNPNLPAPLSNTTLWPKWTSEDKQLLTLSDPLGVDVEKDDFREAGIDFLNELHLAGVTSRGL
ncbi:carotenoid ester lipase precursor [Roridomyces roridus]|uniref:Carboxylic ester hydrolase n=1 Tax=Roridomyces roridus TaxID=1738132 RepID=A0AAD7FZU7_9AGAR|nr:carotenoid ester lipase precursor [Roridomyces roridus]